ncbi:restriction endonuclease subunit S, partial [Vibrio sp. 10N.222.55.C6]|uniref:restriction endonuclease subunit S n=1 Tax=Vibrio sp. 10N.222.55.C6 TaxID=3229649 RepID=UPI003553B20E
VMGSNFFSTTIGEQITLQRGFDITKKEQQEGNVPVVSSGGISSYHNVSKVEAPGVVLGRKGTLGTVFFVEKDFWPHDTSLWVKDFKGNNPQFVYYFFKGMSAELKKMDVGAANPALNRNHVHPLQVEWPRREVQDQIVSVGAALDQKITLNNQINQ